MPRPKRNPDTFEDLQTDKSQDIDAWAFGKCAMTGCSNNARIEHVVMTPVVGDLYVTFYVCSACWFGVIHNWLMGKKSVKASQ